MIDCLLNSFFFRLKLDDLAFEFIDEEEASYLERLFEESEVLEVVKGMNSEKAPDPSDFTMSFFSPSK
jgi:hypothetical protein